MKTRLFIATILLATVTLARAQSNDLSATLQKGLFQEEAAQDLTAAMQTYQAVANQFDKDRQLAATAIFRLGECYRKLGRTNEALAQYDRVVREFSDQQTLAMLSRQNITGLGGSGQTAAASASGQPSGFQESLEAIEIRRIQDMIQNSPDLINAPSTAGIAPGLTPLQEAVAKGQLAVVTMLLERGANENPAKPSETSPLHYAAGLGNEPVVELLLRKGANVGARNENGVTPLHLAALKGYEVVAKTLLEAGAPVDARTTRQADQRTGVYLQYRIYGDQTPLEVAAERGFTHMVSLLIAHHANVNATNAQGETSLFLVVRGQQPDLMKLLLAKGADPNLVNQYGMTALAVAAQNKDPASVKTLLDAHADPNAGRDLPLGETAYNGDPEILKLLLAAGANPNAKGTVSQSVSGNFGGGPWAPLFLAVLKRHPEAVNLLTRAKADAHGADAQSVATIFFSLRDAASLQALLEAGADPNQWIESGNQYFGAPFPGRSLLEQAIADGNQAAVEVLLARGAAVNVADKAGNTPLGAAAAEGATNIVELLLKNGADVNAKDHEGNTALHIATRADHGQIVNLLLRNNADPNVRNEAGETALDIVKGGVFSPIPTRFRAPGQPALQKSAQLSPQEIVRLLREHGAQDNLPHLNRIELSRPAGNFSSIIFRKGTNDWNRFTLLELIAVQYCFLSGDPKADNPADFSRSEGGPRLGGYWREAFFQGYVKRAQGLGGGMHMPMRGFGGNPTTPTTLPFPDLRHVRLRRPAADLKSWNEQTVDLSPLLSSGDCSKDAPLEWGDVIEIPEADHTLDENWKGLSNAEMDNLKKCLTRRVQVIVKGQSTNLFLAPEITSPPNPGPPDDLINPHTPFWIRPALLDSRLLLASSDLSRVKVSRRDGNKSLQWVLDCRNADSAPDFWLRDGDVIEVPEKP